MKQLYRQSSEWSKLSLKVFMNQHDKTASEPYSFMLFFVHFSVKMFKVPNQPPCIKEESLPRQQLAYFGENVITLLRQVTENCKPLVFNVDLVVYQSRTLGRMCLNCFSSLLIFGSQQQCTLSLCFLCSSMCCPFSLCLFFFQSSVCLLFLTCVLSVDVPLLHNPKCFFPVREHSTGIGFMSV